jgi:hypothetical protein
MMWSTSRAFSLLEIPQLSHLLLALNNTLYLILPEITPLASFRCLNIFSIPLFSMYFFNFFRETKY